MSIKLQQKPTKKIAPLDNFIEYEAFHEIEPCMFRSEISYKGIRREYKDIQDKLPDPGKFFNLGEDAGMSDSEIKTLLAYHYFCSQGYGECYASNATLAAKSGLSIPTIIQNTRILEHQNWLIYKGISPSRCKVYIINPILSEHLPITDEIRNTLKIESKLKKDADRVSRKESIKAQKDETPLNLSPQSVNPVYTKSQRDFYYEISTKKAHSDSDAHTHYNILPDISRIDLIPENKKNENSTLLNVANKSLSDKIENAESSILNKDTENKEICLSNAAMLSLRSLGCEIDQKEEEENAIACEFEIYEGDIPPEYELENKENTKNAAQNGQPLCSSGYQSNQERKCKEDDSNLASATHNQIITEKPLESPTSHKDINNEQTYLNHIQEPLKAKIEGNRFEYEFIGDRTIGNQLASTDFNSTTIALSPSTADFVTKHSSIRRLSVLDYIETACKGYEESQSELDRLNAKIDSARKYLHEGVANKKELEALKSGYEKIVKEYKEISKRHDELERSYSLLGQSHINITEMLDSLTDAKHGELIRIYNNEAQEQIGVICLHADECDEIENYAESLGMTAKDYIIIASSYMFTDDDE